MVSASGQVTYVRYGLSTHDGDFIKTVMDADGTLGIKN